MKKRLRKVRKSKIMKEELIADAIFLFIPAMLSFLFVFFFDIHHSFYEWPFTLKFIFDTTFPYIIFTFAGAIIGFFMIKLFLYGLKEEEKTP